MKNTIRHRPRRPARHVAVLIALAVASIPADAVAQTPPASDAARMSVMWEQVPIRDVLMAFSLFSGKSIVAGASVTGSVTASINDQPWDVALQAILSTQGLVATEDESGIIRVDDMASLTDREVVEPLVTRAYPVSYVPAAEVQAAIAPLLSERGSISVSTSRNVIIVTDVARVHRAIGGVVR